jgi:class 3 adenylate cyclase
MMHNPCGSIFCNKAVIFVCLFFFLLSLDAYGQDKVIADSLIMILESGDYNPEDRMDILRDICERHPDPEKKLYYSQELLEAAESLGNIDDQFKGYLEIGNALKLKGDLPEALQNYFKAAEIASDNEMTTYLGKISISIADAYSSINNYQVSTSYYERAIKILRQENDSLNLAIALYNAGDEYYKSDRLDTAILHFRESGDIFRILEYDQQLAYNIGSMGQVHAKLGNNEIAENNLKQAIDILTEHGDYYPICIFLLDLSDLSLKSNDPQNARILAEKSLSYAIEYGLKEQISEANLKLSEIYEYLGQTAKSLDHYKDYISYRDSLNSNVQEIANLRTQFEVAQKQSEVDLLTKEAEIADLKGKRQNWVIFGIGISLVFVVALAFVLFRRYKFEQETNQIIEEEKNRSEDLLLNILPEETAVELKERGSVKAKRIEGVTVLFTDFIKFTRLADQVTPELVVQSIDYYFKQFDEITSRYMLEKIKTIGDSYMCAGGLHSDYSQAREVIKAAKEMVRVIEKAKTSNSDIIHFDMRIGIHTGPVVAGIVGNKKWQYDIWGNTVNVASGMEAKSMAGKINISEDTYNQIKDEFQVEFRGEIDVKHRGPMKMYFVK